MSFAFSDVDLKFAFNPINPEAPFFCLMESAARTGLVDGKIRDYRGTVSQSNKRRSLSLSYFSVESLFVLFCLTASLLILPVVLPPLPPPPFMLLLLPIGILIVLLVLAFMPSDVRDIATSYM